MSRRIVLTAAALGIATLPLLTGVAQAGIVSGTMVGVPNPAQVGELVTVSNSADAASTCEGGEVFFAVFDPSNVEVDGGAATPDGSGNWSFTFTAPSAGTWTVAADCDFGEKVFRGESLQPFFSYNDLFILVQAPGTTVAPTTPTTAGTSSTTAAAAATVTPTFTG